MSRCGDAEHPSSPFSWPPLSREYAWPPPQPTLHLPVTPLAAAHQHPLPAIEIGAWIRRAGLPPVRNSRNDNTADPQLINEELAAPPLPAESPISSWNFESHTPSESEWTVASGWEPNVGLESESGSEAGSDTESDTSSTTSPSPSQEEQPTTSSTQQMNSSHHPPSDFVDLTEETSSPPRSTMPSASGNRGPNKRRRTKSDTSAPSPRTSQRRKGATQDDVPSDIEAVDLRDVDDDQGLLKVLEEQRMATVKSQQEQASKPVKLATLSCVICMDSMSDVTATHCGHLFCHKCLMEALIAGENQGPEPGKGSSKCPVCRKKIKRPGTGKRETGQVVALEIKVKTRSDKGKTKASRESARNKGNVL